MIILDEAKRVLERHHYLISSLGEDAFLFEDDALIGFVCEAPLRQILEIWNGRQTEFVNKHAGILRRSPLKAWNLYSVFLSSDPIGGPEIKRALIKIEEDFHAT